MKPLLLLTPRPALSHRIAACCAVTVEGLQAPQCYAFLKAMAHYICEQCTEIQWKYLMTQQTESDTRGWIHHGSPHLKLCGYFNLPSFYSDPQSPAYETLILLQNKTKQTPADIQRSLFSLKLSEAQATYTFNIQCPFENGVTHLKYRRDGRNEEL